MDSDFKWTLKMDKTKVLEAYKLNCQSFNSKCFLMYVANC
jgi:hypothetical protein